MSEDSLFESDDISFDNSTLSTTKIIRNDSFPVFSANQEHEYCMLQKTNQKQNKAIERNYKALYQENKTMINFKVNL